MFDSFQKLVFGITWLVAYLQLDSALLIDMLYCLKLMYFWKYCLQVLRRNLAYSILVHSNTKLDSIHQSNFPPNNYYLRNI